MLAIKIVLKLIMLGHVINQYKILMQGHTERHNWSNNDQIDNIFNMIFKVYWRKMVEYVSIVFRSKKWHGNL